MDLEEALKATSHHPSAPERVEILREQLGRFRREFFGHITDLKRIEAFQANHPEEKLPADLENAKAHSEASLDNIAGAIEVTNTELKKLDPDA